MTVTIKI